ncbi:hypothetical protein PTKIN_Ptkin05aG0155000 [Pterospermum kingtungense]
MQMQASPVLSLCPSSPSFNTCSSGRLAEIAAGVVEEFRQESGSDQDEIWPHKKQQVIEEEEDDDFEFAFVCREADTSPITADEIFYNGQIRPIYPLFNTKLLDGDQTPNGKNVDSTSRPHRLPLGKLMRETTSSCSSSEADELEGLKLGTYCVWKPKGATSTSASDNFDEETPGRCKKSNSTGSSKRWKLKDLLYRSNSDGKDTFVFLASSKGSDKSPNADVS